MQQLRTSDLNVIGSKGGYCSVKTAVLAASGSSAVTCVRAEQPSSAANTLVFTCDRRVLAGTVRAPVGGMTTQTTIAISSIIREHRSESRRILEDDWEDEVIDCGDDPIIVRAVGGGYAILDGFHRVAAALGRDEDEICAVLATEDEYSRYVGSGEVGESEWVESVLSRAIDE